MAQSKLVHLMCTFSRASILVSTLGLWACSPVSFSPQSAKLSSSPKTNSIPPVSVGPNRIPPISVPPTSGAPISVNPAPNASAPNAQTPNTSAPIAPIAPVAHLPPKPRCNAYSPAGAIPNGYLIPVTSVTASLVFKDSLNNFGQDMHFSNEVQFVGLNGPQTVTLEGMNNANQGYCLNGKFNRFNYSETITVDNGDYFSVGTFTSVWGGSSNTMNVLFNGKSATWTASTIDYDTVGGHNVVRGGNYVPYKCSGAQIATYTLTAVDAAQGAIYTRRGACIDRAQENKDVNCVSLQYTGGGGTICTLYDGPAIEVPGSKYMGTILTFVNTSIEGWSNYSHIKNGSPTGM